MQIVIHTLIDITNTNARKGDDPHSYRQQQNYMTLIQTIGLRSNFEIIKDVTCKKVEVEDKFGSNYKGKNKVWTLEIQFQSQGTDDITIIQQDLDLIPIITGLDETTKKMAKLFRTKDEKEKNIIFKVVDNTVF